MSASRKPRIVEVQMDEVEAALDRAKETLSVEDHELLMNLVESYAYLTEMLDQKTTTIGQLRKLFGGSRSEKTKDVLGESAGAGEEPDPDAARPADDGADANERAERKKTKKRKGHGCNGADAYPGAEARSLTRRPLVPKILS
jgi:hypothetical protein